MSGSKLIRRMRRTDKFQLSGGKLMFAPRYPRWLEAPGFWDEIYYHDEILAPVFTFALLDSSNKQIQLKYRKRLWWPGRSRTVYTSGSDLRLEETRFITPDDRVSSYLSIQNSGEDRDIDLVLWTRKAFVKEIPTVELLGADNSAIRFLYSDRGRRSLFTTKWELTADRPADSFEVLAAECTGPAPSWEQSPFASGWNSKLKSTIRFNENEERGALWCALHYRLHLSAGESEQIALFASIVDENKSTVPAQSGMQMLQTSNASWQDFFEGVPIFRCSSPLWENLYLHRWYLVRQNLKTGGNSNQPHDGICEGSDIFHQPISYSTPPIIYDLRWHQDPTHAQNHILNFCELQDEDGRLVGALHHDRFRSEFFYHADWGGAVERLDSVHPDDKFLDTAYSALSRYADWLAGERDPEDSGMIDVISHFETGQEFNSRYLLADGAFDTEEWLENIRLKGVDSTVYAHLLYCSLERVASRFGNDDDVKRWRAMADKTRSAIIEKMWQSEAGIFSDLVPDQGMRPTQIRALTSFYPFLTDIDLSDYLDSLFTLLLNPDEFWTPYPAATLSRSDPCFDPDGVWRDKHRNCPWNGRVWPMTNSHMVEVLAGASKWDVRLRNSCAELLESFAKLFNPDDHVQRLSSYEHYHPLDGSPCYYRGIDDYLHCWVVDLIIRYVAGFQPGADEIIIDPFPLGLEKIVLVGLPLRGDRYDLRIRGNKARVFKNGQLLARGHVPLKIAIG